MTGKFGYSDAHCDTASRILDNGESFYKNSGQLDIERLKKQNFHIQFTAAFISPEYYNNPYRRCVDIINTIQTEAKENNIPIIKTSEDTQSGGFLISVEGGEALEGDIEKLKSLYFMGVRALTLTWNHKNELACGVKDGNTGLTDFGIQVVREMNRLGMLVDVSHISEAGFWDVAKYCEGSFIASHSNAKTFCSNPRNLTDEQIKEIIKRKGFIGINFYPPFLCNDSKADVFDIVRHIEYIMSLGGEKALGFGADFDGVDCLPNGIDGVQSIEKVADELLKLNYSEDVLNCILYKNLKNVINNTLLNKTIVNL